MGLTTSTPNRKERVTNILLFIITMLTAVSYKIPDFPGITENGITVASTIIMGTIAILGLIRQYLSDLISDVAMAFGWATLVASILEIIADMTGAFNWSEATQQSIRFYISVAITILAVISKMAFPAGTSTTQSRFRI